MMTQLMERQRHKLNVGIHPEPVKGARDKRKRVLPSSKSDMEQNTPKSVGQLLKETYLFYIQHLYQIFLFVCITYIPLGILHVLLLTGVDLERQFNLRVLFYYLILMGANYIYSIAAVKTIWLLNEGKGQSPLEGYKESWPLLGAYFVVFCWYTLKVFLWSLLLVIPGVIFSILYAFCYMAFLVDGYKGKEALVYSKALIKPRVWRYLGNSVVVVLVLIPVYMILHLLAVILFGVGIQGHVSVVPRMGQAILNFTNAFLAMYVTVFFFFLYHEFKKEQ